MAEVYRIEIPINIKDNTDPGVSQAKSKLNAFDRANQKTQDRLNQMNRTKYQIVLDALDRASGIIGKVSSKARSIAGKTFSFTMKVVDMATAPLRGIWNFVTSIQGAITGAAGVWGGIIQPLKLAADFEQTQISLETMLGSVEKANALISKIQTFAAQTPFETSDLMDASKTLLNFNTSAEDVMDVMKQLGDVSLGNNERFQALALVYGQATSNGRLQGQDLLQMINAGWNPLNDIMKRTGETMEQVRDRMAKGGISATELRQALADATSQGGLFYQALLKQSKSLSGLVSTFKDVIKNNLLTKWGQGLAEGIKPTLLKAAAWIDDNQDKIAAWGEAWRKAGANISKWVMSKVEDLQDSIRRMTNSQEWQDAQTFGEKMKVAWDQIIAQPFNEWWNSTGKAWLADKAGKIGEGIGTALSAGLLAILGIDARGAVEDGTSIGASFAEGFTRGFDGKKVGEAILNAIKGVFKDAGTLLPGGEKPSSTSWLSAGAIALALQKHGIFKLIWKGGKGLINLLGKGSKDGVPSATGSLVPDSFITSTMAVTASVVYINGPTIGGGGSGGKIINNIPSLPGGGPATIPKLPGGGMPLALPSAAGAVGNAINTVKLANGTYVASGGALTTGLAKLGVALGSGATTAGGAAAAGTAGIAGIIGGILGLGSAGIDVYQGIKASKAGNNKVAKDEYVTAGTKAGMVGTGALIGTAIMPGLGTLIGAGIGGAAALLTGDKAGKALSDATDKDGALSKFWENTKTWASNTWDSIKTGASNAVSWISDKWSGFSDWFETSIWTPTKDVGISAINIAAGAWSEARDWIGDKWSDLSGWFDESIWTPVSNAAQAASQWVSDRWNEARTWIGERWSDFSTWFEASIWTPVKTGAQAAGQWVSERWNEAKNWVSETWGAVSGWFDKSVWQPVKSAAQTAGAWLGDQFAAAKNAISEAWSGVSGWFEQKVWEPIKNGATRAWEWVGEKLGGIGEWIGDKWQSFKDWLGGLGQKGSKETGLTTSKGKGSILEHAWGGIITKPHMGIVAENGAEGIIPLSPSKRQRGLDLWQRTGELLGVRAYEDGGIVGEEPDEIPVAPATGKAGQNITIKVEVKAEPKFTIEGGGDNTDENKVVAILKAYIREMTDDIGDELAERLARIFANMPVKGVAEA